MAFWETVLGKYIMTMAIAAVPVVELRGAIPAGIAAGLDPWLACGAAIFGNLLPVPFIILLVRQVFDRLRKHAFFAPKIDALERRAHLKGRLVRRKPSKIPITVVTKSTTTSWLCASLPTS